MRAALILLVTGIFFSQHLCQTTDGETAPHGHHHHETKGQHESLVQDLISFNYDSREHMMVIAHGEACYVAQMTEDERKEVHTNTGMHILELSYMSQLEGATEVGRDAIPGHLAHMCRKYTEKYFTIP